MNRKNLLAEYHIRYGGYGGIGYYHVSDIYTELDLASSSVLTCNKMIFLSFREAIQTMAGLEITF